MERAVALEATPAILPDSLPTAIRGESGKPIPSPADPLPSSGFDLDGHLASIERQVLVAALAKAGGVRKDAATLLRMTFRSFRYRLAKYGLGDSDELEQEMAEGA
jgi:two-component system response regulator PilR (NtrC family)